MKDVLDLLARLLIAFIFLFEAYDSIAHWETTQQSMTNYGVTWNQDFLLGGAVTLLIVGGILLAVGYRTGLGAILVLLYWVPATFIVHDFWTHPPGPEYRTQSILFMKNLAITGGLLLLWLHGSARYAVKRLFTTTRVRGV